MPRPAIIGEVISSNVTTGVALTTAVAANVTSISLTAGDWDVQGEVWIQLGTGGATTAHAAINTSIRDGPGRLGAQYGSGNDQR